jgi:ABC-type transporter Mla maintaining outer membrane lipid asymmetry ATPase subunit MlaF
VADDRTPLVEIVALSKAYGGVRPLRVREFRVAAGECIALDGLDPMAAEALVHLVTGAMLPDEGTLRVGGRETGAIASGEEWLTTLDLFGLVTSRAVLVGGLSVEQNLALPYTLSVDPIAPEVRAAVAAGADEVGLPRARLAISPAALSRAEVVRVHLARALANNPRMLLLEHPTFGIAGRDERRALGRTLRRVTDTRGVGWLALTDDREFTRASNAAAVRLNSETGEVVAARARWRAVVTRGWTR